MYKVQLAAACFAAASQALDLQQAAGKNNRPEDKFLTGQTSTGNFDFDQVGTRRPTLPKNMQEESKEAQV